MNATNRRARRRFQGDTNFSYAAASPPVVPTRRCRENHDLCLPTDASGFRHSKTAILPKRLSCMNFCPGSPFQQLAPQQAPHHLAPHLAPHLLASHLAPHLLAPQSRVGSSQWRWLTPPLIPHLAPQRLVPAADGACRAAYVLNSCFIAPKGCRSFLTGTPVGDIQVGVPALISIRPRCRCLGSSSLVRL